LSVEIIADRTGAILLDDLDDDGAVRLLRLFNNLVFCAILYKLFLVVLHFLLDLLYGPIMCDIFLQHEMKSLTDTGCFHSLHNSAFLLFKKINGYRTTGFTQSSLLVVTILYHIPIKISNALF